MAASEGKQAQRATEGSRSGRQGIEYSVKSSAVQSVRKGGRPKGSLNKPKSLVPTELANEILLRLEGQVPDEHMRYLKSVIREGKAISTKNELDVLILLLNRNIWPALLAESNPVEALAVPIDDPETIDKIRREVGPVFRKDVTERLKVLNSLLTLRNQIDKGEKVKDEDGEQPLVRIYADRSIADRLGVLVGYQPRSLSGNADEPERGPDAARTVSDQVPERQLALPSGEQESSDWILDGDSGGGVS